MSVVKVAGRYSTSFFIHLVRRRYIVDHVCLVRLFRAAQTYGEGCLSALEVDIGSSLTGARVSTACPAYPARKRAYKLALPRRRMSFLLS